MSDETSTSNRYGKENYLIASHLLSLQVHGFENNSRCRTKLKPNHLYTFVPSAHQVFNIVAKMDEKYILDSEIEDRDLAWHPFISRIYFGILFLVRTLQVCIPRTIEEMLRLQSLKTQLEKIFVEDLSVPMPLVECFEELAPISGCKKRPQVWITPTLPEEIGPSQAKDLLDFDEDHSHQLILPNIPVFLGLLHDFLEEVDPPSDTFHPWIFTKKPKFDDSKDRELNGHPFDEKDWSPLCKTVFLTPGLSECTAVLYDGWKSQRQKSKLRTLNIPKPQSEDNLRDLLDFMYLKNNADWFSLVCDIMHPYLDFFDSKVRLSKLRMDHSGSLHTLTIYVPPSSTCVEHYNSIYKDVNSIGHGKSLLTKRILSNEGFFMEKFDTLPFSRYQLNVKVCLDDYKEWNAVGMLDKTRHIDYKYRIHDLNVMVVHCVPDAIEDLFTRRVRQHSYYSKICT